MFLATLCAVKGWGQKHFILGKMLLGLAMLNFFLPTVSGLYLSCDRDNAKCSQILVLFSSSCARRQMIAPSYLYRWFGDMSGGSSQQGGVEVV